MDSEHSLTTHIFRANTRLSSSDELNLIGEESREIRGN